MFTIRNNTSYPFQVELSNEIQGPNLIQPNDSSQYGCPGSVPQLVLRAMGPGGEFEVLHEDGQILLVRGQPLARIPWGGQFTLVPTAAWTAIPE